VVFSRKPKISTMEDEKVNKSMRLAIGHVRFKHSERFKSSITIFCVAESSSHWIDQVTFDRGCEFTPQIHRVKYSKPASSELERNPMTFSMCCAVYDPFTVNIQVRFKKGHENLDFTYCHKIDPIEGAANYCILDMPLGNMSKVLFDYDFPRVRHMTLDKMPTPTSLFAVSNIPLPTCQCIIC